MVGKLPGVLHGLGVLDEGGCGGGIGSAQWLVRMAPGPYECGGQSFVRPYTPNAIYVQYFYIETGLGFRVYSVWCRV